MSSGSSYNGTSSFLKPQTHGDDSVSSATSPLPSYSSSLCSFSVSLPRFLPPSFLRYEFRLLRDSSLSSLARPRLQRCAFLLFFFFFFALSLPQSVSSLFLFPSGAINCHSAHNSYIHTLNENHFKQLFQQPRTMK